MAFDRAVPLTDYIRSVADSPSAPIRTVWVSASPERIRGRMIRRDADRDPPKLSNWYSYRE